MKKLFLIAIVIFLTNVCFSQTKKWEETKQINTIEAYQEFLEKYPNRKYSTQAKDKLTSLEYEQAINENTIKQYNYFLREYPKSKYDSEILIKLEKVSWEVAQENKTIISYNDYLKNNPNGINKNEALKQIELIEQENVKRKELIDFTDAAKNGDTDKFQDILPRISDKEILSKALMFAVWGYCHMSEKTTWTRESGMKVGLVRTAKAPKNNYKAIINQLVQSGASIEKFRYQDFGSATPPDPEGKIVSRPGLTISGGKIGTKTDGNLNLVEFNERGMSIKQVVINEKAIELQKILGLEN
ncbi:MAG: hypothetical protein K9J84_13595 [Bacteroidia bacterium]|nr:hypothetical protein [Bacteroidia bacterium]